MTAYTKQTWVDAPATTTPISAARLNYLEEGIETAQETGEAAQVTATAAQVALGDKVDVSDSRLTNARPPTDDSVTTAKIVDANVTLAKLSSSVQATLSEINLQYAFYYVDNYAGADPTGATSSDAAVAAARAAMGTSPGVLVFGAGTYLLTTPIARFYERQSVIGAGLQVTVINYTGTGACISAYDTRTASPTARGGQFIGFTIDGTGCGPNSVGIQLGDLTALSVEVRIINFNNTGCIGFHGINQFLWTERLTTRLFLYKNTVNIKLEGGNGTSGGGTYSFGYGKHWWDIVCDPDQDGVVLKNVNLYHCSITMIGNFIGKPGSNTGRVFVLGENGTTDFATITGFLHVNIETNGPSGAIGHKTFALSTSATTEIRAHGGLRFWSTGGVNFVAGNARGKTSFFGAVDVDTNLGLGTQAGRAIGFFGGSRGSLSPTGGTLFLSGGNTIFCQMAAGANAITQVDTTMQAKLTSTAETGNWYMQLQQPASGGTATMSFPSTTPSKFAWVDSSGPIFSTTPNAIDHFQIWTYDCSTYYIKQINGPVVSANKLTTARNINGVPFDGTANIIIGEPAALGGDDDPSFIGVIAHLGNNLSTVIQAVGDSTMRGFSQAPTYPDVPGSWLGLLGDKLGQYYDANVWHCSWNTTNDVYDAPVVRRTSTLGERYVTTQGASWDAPSVIGDMEVIAWVRSPSWVGSANRTIVCKWNESSTAGRGWELALSTTGKPKFRWSPNGTSASIVTALSATVLPTANNTWLMLRATLDVDNGSGGWTVNFYTSADNGATWTVHGSPITGTGTASIVDNAYVNYQIGSKLNEATNATVEPWDGDIKWVQVRPGLANGVDVVPRLPEAWLRQSTLAHPPPIITSGGPLILLMNGSKGGEALPYFDLSTRRPRLLSSVLPDVIFISDGHNDVTTAKQFAADYITYVRNVKLLRPNVPIIAITQNPLNISSPTDDQKMDIHMSRQKVSYMATALTSEPGVTVLDTRQAFTDIATQIVPGIGHPTTAGYQAQADWTLKRLAPKTMT